MNFKDYLFIEKKALFTVGFRPEFWQRKLSEFSGSLNRWRYVEFFLVLRGATKSEIKNAEQHFKEWEKEYGKKEIKGPQGRRIIK